MKCTEPPNTSTLSTGTIPEGSSSRRFWKLLLVSCFVVFAIHLSINLERIAFVNEIFTLTGLLSLAITLNKDRLVSRIDLIFSLFLSYMLAHLGYAAITTETDPYLFFRTTPIVYSALGYFLGKQIFNIYHLIPKVIEKTPKILIYVLSVLFGWRVTAAAGFLLLLINSKKKFLIALIAFSIFFWLTSYRTGDNDSTCILIIFLLVFVTFFPKKLVAKTASLVFGKIVLFTTIISTIVALCFAYDLFQDFYVVGYAMFQNAAHNNTIWRLMFWAMTVYKTTYDNPAFGIGLGTPIYDYFDPATSFISRFGEDDESQAYTLGLHNSFLDIYVRFGIVGLTLFLLLISNSVKKAAHFSQESESAYFLLVIFLILIIGATFNVVLLTPLAAAPFWIALGLMNEYVQKSAHKSNSATKQEIR